MLGVAETTWCRSTRAGQAGYAPLLAAAGLLVREDWDRYRLPAWEALQHRTLDGSLHGRFVYTHRPAFRATVVRWRLAGVSLAALGAWSLLRYCHTRWDTAELNLCDAAIARLLAVKPHTWASYASELVACGGLQPLGPHPGAGWRLPCYFILRTGRDLDQARTSRRARMSGMGRFMQDRLSHFMHLRQTVMQHRQPGSVIRARAKTRLKTGLTKTIPPATSSTPSSCSPRRPGTPGSNSKCGRRPRCGRAAPSCWRARAGHRGGSPPNSPRANCAARANRCASWPTAPARCSRPQPQPAAPRRRHAAGPTAPATRTTAVPAQPAPPPRTRSLRWATSTPSMRTRATGCWRPRAPGCAASACPAQGVTTPTTTPCCAARPPTCSTPCAARTRAARRPQQRLTTARKHPPGGATLAAPHRSPVPARPTPCPGRVTVEPRGLRAAAQTQRRRLPQAPAATPRTPRRQPGRSPGHAATAATGAPSERTADRPHDGSPRHHSDGPQASCRPPAAAPRGPHPDPAAGTRQAPSRALRGRRVRNVRAP